MDTYTIELTQDGKTWDITKFVGDPQMRDDGDAYCVEFTFHVATNPHDYFLPKLGIEVKDGVKLKNDGKVVFDGFVTTRTKDGQITCRDVGFYFKSDVTCQFRNSRADAAIAAVCKRAGVGFGWYGGLEKYYISGEYIRQQASSVIDDIIEQVNAMTDKPYIHRIIDKKLCVRAYDTNVSKPTYTRPVSSPFPITWVKGGVEVSSTMDDMATNILVQTDDGNTTKTLARAYDEKQGQKYGYITKMLTVDADQQNTATAVLAAAVEQYGQPKNTARVTQIWGSDAVIPGMLLDFGSKEIFGLIGKWWVTSVNHSYTPYHTMSLELLQHYTPREITMLSVPQGTTASGTTTTTTTKTLLGNFKLTFYAGDTSTASGKKPRVNHTIAVDPKVIPMGSQVYIDGWGTYTAEDTGGAIKGKIIDIFVSSEKIARQYGVKHANVYKITAVTSTSGAVTSLAQKMVNIALAEEGYKESSGKRTKYGKWFGMDGNNWCAMFVSWCANRAGIPTSVIPKDAAVAGHRRWFQQRGKYKPKSSGYHPKAGDLMIQKENGASHIGIVVKSDSSRFYTIEGNTSHKVAQRSYPYSDRKLSGFCTPWG